LESPPNAPVNFITPAALITSAAADDVIRNPTAAHNTT
jgi:hypothetical protein